MLARPPPLPCLALVLALCAPVAACGSAQEGRSEGAGHGAAPSAGMPAARRWVAVGVTNSYIGPQRVLLTTAGQAPPARSGDRLITLSARRAARVFTAVRGARAAAAPVAPTTCADCGARFAQADGAYFRAPAAFLRELARLGVTPPG